MEILKILLDRFDFLLLAYGFEILKGKIYSKASGYIILQNEFLKLKLISERRKVFTAISSNSDKEDWVDLPLVKKLLDGEFEIQYLDVDQQSKLLETSIEQINFLFSESKESTQKNIEKIREELMKKRGW